MDDVPSLELLRDFDALFRERHLTRAALRARRSQPAMSRSLLRLREFFSDALFVRTSRGMIPTPRAEELAPRVEALLESARLLVAKPTFHARALERSFVMATSDLVDMQLLSSLTSTLAIEAPLVDITSVSAAAATTETLAEGSVDLWIGPDGSIPAGTRRQHLFDDEFLCAVRRGHPLLASLGGSRKRTKNMQDAFKMSVETFASLSHIQIAPRGTSGGPVDVALAQLGLRRRVAARTTSFLAAPWLAARSDMVLTAPSRLLRALEGPFELVTFAPPLSVKGFRIFQAWHPRVQADAAHRWFRGVLQRVATEIPLRRAHP